MKKQIWKFTSLFAAVLALSLCFAGCSSDDDDDGGSSGDDSVYSISREDIAGTWTGEITFTTNTNTHTLSLTLDAPSTTPTDSEDPRYYKGTGSGTVTSTNENFYSGDVTVEYTYYFNDAEGMVKGSYIGSIVISQKGKSKKVLVGSSWGTDQSSSKMTFWAYGDPSYNSGDLTLTKSN